MTTLIEAISFVMFSVSTFCYSRVLPLWTTTKSKAVYLPANFSPTAVFRDSSYPQTPPQHKVIKTCHPSNQPTNQPPKHLFIIVITVLPPSSTTFGEFLHYFRGVRTTMAKVLKTLYFVFKCNLLKLKWFNSQMARDIYFNFLWWFWASSGLNSLHTHSVEPCGR